MKPIFSITALLLFVFLFSTASAEQSITGTWRGKLSTGPDFEMTVQFVISQDDTGAYAVVVSSPDGVGIEDTSANDVRCDGADIEVDVADLSGSYEGIFKEGKITGEWKQEGSSFPLILSPVNHSSIPEEIVEKLLGQWYTEIPSITGPSAIESIYRFRLTQDGKLDGVMKQSGPVDESDIPLADFEMTEDGHLTFRIMMRNRMVFKGKVEENKIIGAVQWQPGAPYYPQLLKKGEFKPGDPGKEIPDEIKEKLLGKWHGKLGASEMTFSFEQPMPGMFFASIDTPGQETESVPFTSSDIDGEKIILKTEFLNAEFNGRMSENSLEGEWIQDGKNTPLLLMKETP